MFDEIDKLKIDLPKFKQLNKEIKIKSFNNYQQFAIVVLIIGLIIGVVLGNMFTVCGSVSNFYSSCSSKEFNFVLMTVVWSISLLTSVFLFWMGHIIQLLKSIDRKLK